MDILRPTRGIAVLAAIAVSLSLIATANSTAADVNSPPTGAFELEKELHLPGTPEEVYDAFTKETLNWWDHHHSEAPQALYFDTRPGGGFVEIFDNEGNFATHGKVIYAHRGRRLRWTGPMGFSGMALEMVHTIDLQPTENGATRLELTVRGVGQLEEGWSEAADRVWDHFLFERFEPYMKSRFGRGEDEAPLGSAPPPRGD